MKTIDSRPKKLIEVALPLPEINDASAYDKMPGIGPHPKGIHHWWARLPLPVARAVLFASTVDDPSSHPERFPTPEAQDRERERLFGIIRRLTRFSGAPIPEASDHKSILPDHPVMGLRLGHITQIAAGGTGAASEVD